MEHLIYFGCGDRPGHFFWKPERFPHRFGPDPRHHLPTFPWEHVDGTLPPQDDRTEGVAVAHYANGWTALAWWDYSVDSRGGCNSALFVNEHVTPKRLIELGREHFPAVFERINYGIKLP